MSKPSDTQKTYYYLFLLPMWRGQLDKLLDAERNYRYHLLAVECLRKAQQSKPPDESLLGMIKHSGQKFHFFRS
jgi:hypothetical protein